MSYWPIPNEATAVCPRRTTRSRLRIFTPPNLAYFFMNTRVAPFDKLAVRRAVQLRDLEEVARPPRRRARAPDREHPPARLSVVPEAQALRLRPPQGEEARGGVGRAREAGDGLEP